jgi:hypothetical protein
MKAFVAGVIAGVTVGGGVLAAAGLPNPQVGECVWSEVVFTRSQPTMIQPEGEVTGGRIWQACGYQVPTGVGSNMRAVDEAFWTDIDADTAEMLIAASDDLLDE